MERLLRPVIISTSSSPAATASSTTYWIAGLSTTGSISLGVALVAGKNLVPSPAAGMTALVTASLSAMLRTVANSVQWSLPEALGTVGSPYLSNGGGRARRQGGEGRAAVAAARRAGQAFGGTARAGREADQGRAPWAARDGDGRDGGGVLLGRGGARYAGARLCLVEARDVRAAADPAGGRGPGLGVL